jgi:exosome complex protein LRP1
VPWPALTREQGDNKDIKAKLTELIAKEREKAVAKSTEKKRPAEESAVENSSTDAGQKLPKRPKSATARRRNENPVMAIAGSTF